ncbi:MAG: alpha-amylase family glycosyl hydrolase, partial [Bacteroidota bacterium]
MAKSLLLSLLIIASLWVKGQITTVPEIPVATKKVTITFDSSKESKLGYFTGELYAHTGVNDWKHVIESWGDNSTQPKLTYKGDGIYELEITPDINTFYSVDKGERVTRMCFVFRSADASEQTSDLFVNVYEDGLVVEITEPSGNPILQKNETVTFSARSSEEASLKLFLNENLLADTTGTEISSDYIFTESGGYWLIAEATADTTVVDSQLVFVRADVTEEPKPAAYKKGINYPSDNSAALVLWAPLKEFVFVLGDFNDWEPSNDYLMKKDGDYFWLEIPNLEKGKEYIFQYLIDGEIKIADPYTEKIVDPWNDKDIPETTYPNLIDYPEDKTDGIASVLQPGQDEYEWEVTDFQIPEKEKLVIYELLVRDFTEEQTFKAVREKLDYLEDLRINALELMPVNEFEGNSSWGYNTSFYFAPDKYYGSKNELKKLIDECHKRGIAVIIDMVLNHSYGQSPFAQMYMDNWTILPENPWYNVESPNQVYHWGYDLNHEREAVKELVDSVNSFWINEYKIDGFRFDFTKGFTQTPGDGWAYDAPRIAILKRMANEIWERKPDALVILEHLADNSEETELANHGIMLWGNMHGTYTEAARGNTGSSDLSWAIHSERNWNEPNLVSYPESHDEERIMFTIKNTGLSSGDYNIKNQQTALARIELNTLFHIPLPGPKMIWQFGERGYDVSINAFGGRTDPKPPYWQYLNNTNRTDLFQVMAKLNELKQTYEEFTPENMDYSLTGVTKWYKLQNGDNHVVALGNFDVEENEVNITLPETGKYYEFFTRDSVEFTNTLQNITLAPGEYRLYSTRNFADPHVVTDLEVVQAIENEISIFPNPATTEITVTSTALISKIVIYSLSGKTLMQHNASAKSERLNIDNLQGGMYIVRI